MKHIIVVGGGISGLAAAHRLIVLSREMAADVRVTLLESSERLGGKILTERVPLTPAPSRLQERAETKNTFSVEREREQIKNPPLRRGEGGGGGEILVLEGGPDSFITAKPHALNLIRELGLESHLVPTDRTNTDVFVFTRGRLKRIPAGIFLMAPSRLTPFLLSDFMTWRGKLRMALDFLLPRGHKKDESMGAFARRRFGKEALDVLVQPVMAGIYAGDAEALSLRSTFPRFLELEQRHGSVIRGLRTGAGISKKTEAGPTLFMTLSGGLVELVEAISARIGPGVLRVGTGVSGLQRSGTGWRVDLEGAKSLDCDAVILTAPAQQAARMVRKESPELSSALEKIPFVSTATLSLGYREPHVPQLPAGFGFVVARSEVRTISAGTFTSFKFPARVPKGTALLRCFLGGAGRESIMERSDAELIRTAQEDLKRILGIDAPPETTRLYRWPGANPQYLVGHEQLMSGIENILAKSPGLWLAGASYRGVGIPDSIASGEEAARKAFQAL